MLSALELLLLLFLRGCSLDIDAHFPSCSTSTVWKSLNPFFGEDFHLSLANEFQVLEILVYDADKIKVF